MSAWNDLTKGILRENPVLRLMIGLCPVLAVSTSAYDALGMGIATSFVLICSNITVSLIRRLIPNEIRIPIFVVTISSFVTIADYIMKAYAPVLSESLGVFVPLIVVNCIILGRSEAFAYKNSVFHSFLDAVGMSLGFILAIVTLGSIREILGNGSIFGIFIMGSNFQPFLMMIFPPGAFLIIGFLMAGLNRISMKRQ